MRSILEFSLTVVLLTPVLDTSLALKMGRWRAVLTRPTYLFCANLVLRDFKRLLIMAQARQEEKANE